MPRKEDKVTSPTVKSLMSDVNLTDPNVKVNRMVPIEADVETTQESLTDDSLIAVLDALKLEYQKDRYLKLVTHFINIRQQEYANLSDDVRGEILQWAIKESDKLLKRVSQQNDLFRD